MNIYCNNCGIKGHVFKDCLSPILSCGVILCKKYKDIYKVLMINRKDSLCYIDFLRGKYNLMDMSYIQLLINKITIDEKNRLLIHSFDELWKLLWNISELSEEIKSKNDYKDGKRKYESLKKGFYRGKDLIQLKNIIQISTTDYKETEWEFPKGRRNRLEKNKDCAIREVNEETNYTINDYEILQNIIPLTEEFKGENMIRYKYLYYVGIVTNIEKECKIDKNNISQIQEISNLEWLTKDEAFGKIRDYHSSRKILIQSIYDLLENIGKDLILL